MCGLPKRNQNAELCGILALAGYQNGKKVLNATGGGDALKLPLQHCFLTPGAE